MTQTTGYDTETVANPLEFETTPLRRQRHETWVKGYARKMGELWEMEGADLKDPDIRQQLQDIRETMMVPELEQWMSASMAVATLNARHVLDMSDSSDNLRYRNALRTLCSLTISEKKKVVAQAMGILPIIASRMYSLPSEDLKGATSVYRHFDSAGTLLYVGIAADLDSRNYWHRRNSKWFISVSRTTLEWFNTRVEALKAETRAIKTEEPVFNVASASEEVKARAAAYSLP